MGKQKKPIKKRSEGTEDTLVLTGVRLPRTLLSQVDEQASVTSSQIGMKVSRSAMIRMLLMQALDPHPTNHR